MKQFSITGPVWITAVALGCLTGCTGTQADSSTSSTSPKADVGPARGAVPSDTAPIQYGISYTVGPNEYDAQVSQPAFDACAGLPGAFFAGAAESLPPLLSVQFVGNESEKADLVACLRALPDTQLSGPFNVSNASSEPSEASDSTKENSQAPSPASPLPGPTVVPSDDSVRLTALQGVIIEDRRLLSTGQLDGSALTSAGAANGNFDLDINLQDHPPTVVVGLEEVTEEAKEWFLERYGSSLSFQAGLVKQEP